MALFKNRWFQFLTLFLLILVGRRIYLRFLNPNLIVTFFDVGQGDAALIQFPYGRTMLIDAGGGWGDRNLGSRVLIPELTRLGILSLDRVEISHPDQDHAYGLVGILPEMKVGDLWAPWKTRDTPLMHSIRSRVEPNQLVWLNSLAQFNWSGVEVQVLAPQQSHTKNDASLVTQIKFGRCSLLFTGDLEAGGEEEVLTRLPRQRVSVLKIPHHGSKTSSTNEFLKHFRPQVGVVSVGRKNHYGHPNRSVLERFRKLGSQVFRTDFHGKIRLTFSRTGWLTCEDQFGSCGRERCRY